MREAGKQMGGVTSHRALLLIAICGLVSEALTCITGENARLATNREELVCIGAIVLEKSVVGQFQLVANIKGDLSATAYVAKISLRAMHNEFSISLVEHFSVDSLVDSCIHVDLGPNTLQDGAYRVIVYLEDLQSKQADEALLAAIDTNVVCCEHVPNFFNIREQASSFPRKNGVVPERLSDGTLGLVASYPGYMWWFDQRVPGALELYDLDTIYGDNYHEQDKLDSVAVADYAQQALKYCAALQGRPCSSVLDAGAARCYLSAAMGLLGADVFSVEGTTAGVHACRSRVANDSVLQHDLRKPLALPRRFDLVTCTEVAEHIEPPFAGTLVHTLTSAADVVWFSAEAPNWAGGNNPDHIHHSNEQPREFWDRLFAFSGFRAMTLPADYMYHVYYRESTIAFDPNSLTLANCSIRM
jgi:hypothetical protein